MTSPDHEHVAAVLTGVMLAVLDGRHHDADALIASLTVRQMPQAIAQLAVFITGLALAGGATTDQVRGTLSAMALAHAQRPGGE